MRLQQGISLLEVLLAVLLLKVSVLGALAGQLHARQMVTEALQRTQAVAMAEDWLNRMQAAGASHAELSPFPECSASLPCPSETIANWLHQQWHQQWWLGPNALAQGGYCELLDDSSAELVLYWHSRSLLSESLSQNPCGQSGPKVALQLQVTL
ncbi:hypothetical protein Q3O59_12070 [Alkalimonas delamerensis]|uniref:Type IV pilus assembly protein PilV n=1 Tax=Alkalimonas delamerensis TaxID=265981 RepID=A0ABT9GS42_9GAMM|nr:hypothetical protein [Alkalimonas delamerensis]MDP4529759.1 hypothetical protein [Alkalimonas delamerensis]